MRPSSSSPPKVGETRASAWMRAEGAAWEPEPRRYVPLPIQVVARRWLLSAHRGCGRTNLARSVSTVSRIAHASAWSFTIPMLCMKAYAVVGPTKVKPLRFSSFARATDSRVVATIAGGAGVGSNDQMREPSEPNSFATSSERCALLIVERIFP